MGDEYDWISQLINPSDGLSGWVTQSPYGSYDNLTSWGGPEGSLGYWGDYWTPLENDLTAPNISSGDVGTFNSGTTSPSWWQSLLKGAGLLTDQGGANLSSLLPMLLAAGSGAYAMNRTNKATDQTVNAINSANEQITGLLGGAKSLYDPYVSAGTSALDKLATQAPSNLAGKYQPLAGMGGVTLNRFARGK